MPLLKLELVGFLRFPTQISYADALRLETKIVIDYAFRR